MKRYVRAETSFTTDDYKAALLLLKHSVNPKEVERAQTVIREFKATNPELAEKVKSELNQKRERKPKSAPSKYRFYRW